MIYLDRIEHTPRLIKKLSDESGVPINEVKVKWDSAIREVNKMMMWEPNVYRDYVKQTGNKFKLVEDKVREFLGIGSDIIID